MLGGFQRRGSLSFSLALLLFFLSLTRALVCLRTKTVPTFQSFDTSTGTLYLKWSSAAACPVGSEAPPPKDDEGGKEGGEQGGDKEEESKGGMGWFGWLVTL